MPSNSIKCIGNLGKIIPALKYLIYAMQNSPCGRHPRLTGVIYNVAPMKYPAHW
jgi:hypothetical protein